jgi:hypothetical protein
MLGWGVFCYRRHLLYKYIKWPSTLHHSWCQPPFFTYAAMNNMQINIADKAQALQQIHLSQKIKLIHRRNIEQQSYKVKKTAL